MKIFIVLLLVFPRSRKYDSYYNVGGLFILNLHK